MTPSLAFGGLAVIVSALNESLSESTKLKSHPLVVIVVVVVVVVVVYLLIKHL